MWGSSSARAIVSRANSRSIVVLPDPGSPMMSMVCPNSSKTSIIFLPGGSRWFGCPGLCSSIPCRFRTASFRSPKPSSISTSPCRDGFSTPLTQESLTSSSIPCRLCSSRADFVFSEVRLIVGVSLTTNEPTMRAIAVTTGIKGSYLGLKIQIMATIKDAPAMTRNINRHDIENIVSPHIYKCLGWIIITSPRFMTGYRPPLV